MPLLHQQYHLASVIDEHILQLEVVQLVIIVQSAGYVVSDRKDRFDLSRVVCQVPIHLNEANSLIIMLHLRHTNESVVGQSSEKKVMWYSLLHTKLWLWNSILKNQ